MDILTLKIYNSLQKLGLSKKDFEEIELEQNNDKATGLYIQKVVVSNNEKYMICVSHDKHNTIEIKQIGINNKNIYSFPSSIKMDKSRVLFKTLIAFSDLDLPKEIYTLHQITNYKETDDEIKSYVVNMEELKDTIMDTFAFEYPKELGKIYEELEGNYEQNKLKRYPIIQEQLRALYWLFGEKYEHKDIPSRVNVPRIIKVFQRNNRRLAIIQTKEDWDLKKGFMWKKNINRVMFEIKTYKPSDKNYNYVNQNREFAYVVDGGGEVFLDDEVFEQISSNELYQYCRQLQKGVSVLMIADLYNEVKPQIRNALTVQQRQKEEEETEKIIKEKITKQFRKGSVTRCGIKFTQKSINYEGISIKSNKVADFLISDNKLQLEEIDFKELYDDFIDYVTAIHYNYDYYPPSAYIRYEMGNIELIKINNIKVKIERIKKIGFLINGFRISKYEVTQAIKNAINFKSQDSYDKWLEFTGKVNIKFQKSLEQGFIEFKVPLSEQEDNDLTDGYGCNQDRLDTIDLIIPIARENNENFVVLKNRKLKIKNINSFLNLETCDYAYRYFEGDFFECVIHQLNKAISKITTDDITDMMKEGMKNLEIKIKKKREEEQKIIKRSEEFLKNAIRLTNAVKVRKGYIVKGLSKNHYFVDDSGGCWTAKDYKKETYLCIVDVKEHRAEGQAGANDQIANRLLMLSKDIKVAKEIWDSGDKTDKWWFELQQKEMGVVA